MPLRLNILLAVCALMLPVAPTFAQPIYRVVDENGNVTYTDQKPSDDAVPMVLPEISVISETAPPIEPIGSGDTTSSAVQPFQMEIVEPADGSVIANALGQIDLRF